MLVFPEWLVCSSSQRVTVGKHHFHKLYIHVQFSMNQFDWFENLHIFCKFLFYLYSDDCNYSGPYLFELSFHVLKYLKFCSVVINL